MATIQEKTTARRIRIDALLKAAKRMISSSETTLAYRNLQMAKHNLGNVLKLSGGTTPYTVVSEVSNIPPTADVSEQPAFELSESHLNNVNTIREIIERELTSFTMEYNLELQTDKTSLLTSQLYEHYNNLLQAKSWYGEELSEMRTKEKEAAVKASLVNGTSEPAKEMKYIVPLVTEVVEPKEKKKTSTKKIVE